MALNPQQQRIIINEIKKSLGKKDGDKLSKYELAKGAWRLRKVIRREIRYVILMLLGILSAGFGLKGFLIYNGLIDGGVMGISLLVNKESGTPYHS